METAIPQTKETMRTDTQIEFINKLSKVNLGRPAVDQDPITGEDILEFLGSEHFHEKKINAKKTLTTPHSEDLLTHLLSAGEICEDHVMANNFFEGRKWMGMNIGFWHDIGKPGCTTRLSSRLSMKFHGVVGGALIENLLTTDSFKSTFGLTDEDIATISAAADVHMCGYFPGQGQKAGEIHMDTLRLLPRDVKIAVGCLRVGDQLGMKHRDMDEEEFRRHGMQISVSQGEYMEDILSDLNGSDYAMHHARDSGCLIHVNGISGAGKSTLANKILTRLKREVTGHGGLDVFLLSRDDYIMEVTREKMTASGIIRAEERLGYRESYLYYQEHKTHLSSEVNRRMNKRMEELLNSRHIVITDTMATMWPSRDTITAGDAVDAFRVSLWVHSNADLPESHHDMSVDQQREVNKNVFPTKWNPIASSLQWRELTSCLEHKLGEMDKKSTVVLKPHLALSYGRAGLKDKLIDHLLDKILQMNLYWTPLPRCPLLEQTKGMDLEGLVRNLYELGEESIVSFFKVHNYKVKVDTIDSVTFVTVKYEEGRNRLWKELWMREARGRTIAVAEKESEPDPDHDDDLGFSCVAITVKSQHERSPELLTASHYSQGVQDTQDLSKGQTDLSHLSKQTIRLSEIVNSTDEFEEPVMVCDKVDGCTGIITLVSERTLNTTDRSSDEDILLSKVAAIVLRTQWCVRVKFRGQAFIVMMSSSGVFGLNKSMKAYFLTSLVQACKTKPDCHPYEVMRACEECQRRVIQAESEEELDRIWNEDGTVIFAYWIREYLAQAFEQRSWELLVSNQPIWFVMTELVCAKRKSFSGEVFNCLATSYAEGGIYVLGQWVKGLYVPAHGQESSDVILYPDSRIVDHQDQLAELMRSIMDYTIPEKQPTNSKATGLPMKHYEGYVAHTLSGWAYGCYPVVSASVSASGKIKTPDFYKLHKWQKYGIDIALAMPRETDQIYPIVGQLKKLMQSQGCECDNAATDLMYDILKEVVNNTDAIRGALPEKAHPRLDAYLNGTKSGSEAGMILKVLANTMTPDIESMSAFRARQVLKGMGCSNEALENDEKMCSLGRKILMASEPWVDRAGTGKLSARFPDWRAWKIAGGKSDRKMSKEDHVLNDVFDMATGA